MYYNIPKARQDRQAAVALWRDCLISLALCCAHAHAKRIRSNSRIRMRNPKYMREETIESVHFYASSAKLTVASQSVLVARVSGSTTRCYNQQQLVPGTQWFRASSHTATTVRNPKRLAYARGQHDVVDMSAYRTKGLDRGMFEDYQRALVPGTQWFRASSHTATTVRNPKRLAYARGQHDVVDMSAYRTKGLDRGMFEDYQRALVPGTQWFRASSHTATTVRNPKRLAYARGQHDVVDMSAYRTKGLDRGMFEDYQRALVPGTQWFRASSHTATTVRNPKRLAYARGQHDVVDMSAYRTKGLDRGMFEDYQRALVPGTQWFRASSHTATTVRNPKRLAYARGQHDVVDMSAYRVRGYGSLWWVSRSPIRKTYYAHDIKHATPAISRPTHTGKMPNTASVCAARCDWLPRQLHKTAFCCCPLPRLDFMHTASQRRNYFDQARSYLAQRSTHAFVSFIEATSRGVGSIPTRRIFEVRFFAWCGRACARGGAGTTQKEDPGYVISLRSGKKTPITVRAGSDRITISRSPRRGLTKLAIDGAQHSHDEVRSENHTHKRAPDAGAKAHKM
ncbi:unnamed protein product [Trichogramma brassicae]|uniref:Uncharacterized protein n=1 Tax=Trichogramma brassicae TaxID=86971 RepID=A0A6H5IGM1_9HYME|nr:unnamed protein product [Trichogramma brassicae]